MLAAREAGEQAKVIEAAPEPVALRLPTAQKQEEAHEMSEGRLCRRHDRRFTLDERRYVIDLVNADNSGKSYCHEGAPEDDKYLREHVLQGRLHGMLDKLIINLRPMQKLPSGEEYKPQNEETFAIWWALVGTIAASHLNTFDPALSIQHKFDGKLKSQKKHTQDFTSLALFRDDVECLLRDLYGDVESEALNSILRAVFRIVQQFTRYVCPELWKEHDDAEKFDRILFGTGLPEGYGISSSEFHRGMRAKFDLIFRACEVHREPSAFSEYTVKFANWFGEQWDCSPETLLSMMGPPNAEMNA